LKVLQSIEDPEVRKNLTPIKLRKKAAKFAIGTSGEAIETVSKVRDLGRV
jgi:hypothetical protein